MPLTRWQISARASLATPVRDAFVNTLYFNVSSGFPLDGTGWDTLGNDLRDIWNARPWAQGCYVDIRGYDMSDPEPRPPHYQWRGSVAGTRRGGVPQVALALSYYAERNLPRQRGRIFLGPWLPAPDVPTAGTITEVMALPPLLAGLGGVNVDWSLYSPTRQAHDAVTDAWCDNSWDIIRSRKLPATTRQTWSGNG